MTSIPTLPAALPFLGSKGSIKIQVQGDNSTQSRTDANALSISYVGPSSVSSIALDVTNANPNGGSVVNPSTPDLGFDTRPAATGQSFVVGSQSVGLTSVNVMGAMLNQVPAVAGKFFTMRLDFTPSSFTTNKTLRFGVARNTFRSHSARRPEIPAQPSPATSCGSNVRIPAGTTAVGGMTSSGMLADDTPFSGTFMYRTASGQVIPSGFINAQSAVAQPIPRPKRDDGAAPRTLRFAKHHGAAGGNSGRPGASPRSRANREPTPPLLSSTAATGQHP